MKEFGVKVLKWGFTGMMGLILLTICAADFFNYTEERTFLLPNTVVVLAIAAGWWLVHRVFARRKRSAAARKDVSEKKFWLIMTGVFAGVLILQFIMIYALYLYTGWDVSQVRHAAQQVLETGSLGQHWYFSFYPNNLVLLFLLVAIQSVPVVGAHYPFLLIINTLLVTAAGVMICLVMKKLVSRRAGLWSLALSVPVLLLNPWLTIPYSDTFAVLLPILVFYIYICENKRWWHWLFIGLISIIGMQIKPTVIIVLIAMAVIESWKFLFAKKRETKKFGRAAGFVVVGLIAGMLAGKVTTKIVGFEQNPDIPTVSFVHYLALGQNTETHGAYSDEDFAYSNANGRKADIKRAINRFLERDFRTQVKFWASKLAFSYNDGTFKWGGGAEFYKVVVPREDKLSAVLREIFYDGGAYFKIYVQVAQAFWILTLIGGLILGVKSIREKKFMAEAAVLMLSLVGFFMFLMLFESQARYIYCYAPMFIAAAVLGYKKLLSGGRNVRKVKA